MSFSGSFEDPGDYWDSILATTSWVVEVRARRGKRVEYALAPTSRTCKKYPAARKSSYILPHPKPRHGPFFDARVFVRDRGVGDDPFKQWARRTAGIRVYMEGFRVVPYGEPRNDWLGLDADYTVRAGSLTSLEGLRGIPAEIDEEETLTVLPNDAYLGAVFLTERGSPGLRTLVNREGFVPDDSYDALVRLVRIGVDLSTRARAAASEERRRARREQRRATQEAPGDDTDDESGSNSAPLAVQRREALRSGVARAAELSVTVRTQMAGGDVTHATSTIEALERQIAALDNAVTDFVTEQALLPVLASVGIQMARFVHEVNGLLSLTRSVESALARLRGSEELAGPVRRELAGVYRTVADLRHRLERQATYLVDVGSRSARRRRSRQRLAERADAALELVKFAAADRAISVSNEIPRELRSPPMFPAELTAIFANLLTNAVKAAGERGRVRVRGTQRDGRVRIVMENTGIAVNPADGERWFRPFESTTELVDPVLGQGLGLGLPITRALLEEYGGAIRFIKPSRGYSTAIEVVL